MSSTGSKHRQEPHGGRATQALAIVAVTMLGLGFPYSPAQTRLTLFTVGRPTDEQVRAWLADFDARYFPSS